MAGRIGRDVMVPQFEQAKYYEGVHESLKVIFSLIQKDPDVVSQYSGSSNYKGARIDYFILLFVILLVITSAIRKSETKGKKWGMRGIYVLPIVLGVFVGAALLAGFAILSIIFFAISFLPPPKTHPGMFYGMGFFGGNGGFGSGGFGGFGGGGFGGGGFSGGW